jgi:hypothetical protein
MNLFWRIFWLTLLAAIGLVFIGGCVFALHYKAARTQCTAFFHSFICAEGLIPHPLGRYKEY